MRKTSDWHAIVANVIEEELSEIFSYCGVIDEEKYTILPGIIAAAATIIVCFIEPEHSEDDVRVIAKKQCMAIGVSLADIRSATDSDTVDKPTTKNEAVSHYIEDLGDDPSFLNSRSKEVRVLALLHLAEKISGLPHNFYVLRNDISGVGGRTLSYAMLGYGPKPTSGLYAKPPVVHSPGVLLSDDQVVALWRLIEVEVLQQSTETAQQHRSKAGKASATSFAIRKFANDMGMFQFSKEKKTKSGDLKHTMFGELSSAIAHLLSIVLPDGVEQDEVRKMLITN